MRKYLISVLVVNQAHERKFDCVFSLSAMI